MALAGYLSFIGGFMAVRVLPFLIAGVFLVSGCTAQMQVDQAYQSEGWAWQRAVQDQQKECGLFDETNSLPRSKAMDYFNCTSASIDEWVRPAVINPAALNGYVSNLRGAFSDYSKSKINEDTLLKRMTSLEKSYSDQLMGAYNAQMVQAERQDAEHAARERALQESQWARDEQRRAEQTEERRHREIVRALEGQNRSMSTTCHTYGNTTNCDTSRY